jgi:hypothetical protein
MVDQTLRWFLMSGREALDPERILMLFERIKGRPATADEIAELAKRKILPGKRGIPSLEPIGTGIGFTIGGVATKAPKKNA